MVFNKESGESTQYNPGEEIDDDSNKLFVLEDFQLIRKDAGIFTQENYLVNLAKRRKATKKVKIFENSKYGIPIKESYVIDKTLKL